MPSERDLFANFERMRREMDELFGDAFDRVRPRRRSGFTPAVDVYYLTDPPRAMVRADLAGVRRPEQAEGRSYQQLEIETGPFRRVISLGIEVDPEAARAHYDDGMLTVELPVLSRSRSVPIEKP